MSINFEEEIAKVISQFSEIPAENCIKAINKPKDPKLGDFAVSIGALNKFKRFEQKPPQLAEEWSQRVSVCV